MLDGDDAIAKSHLEVSRFRMTPCNVSRDCSGA